MGTESDQPRTSARDPNANLDVGQVWEKVQQLAQTERAREARRGPLGRTLRWFALIFGVITAGAILYGALNFPDAPIRSTDAGFISKTGVAYSLEHFEHFKAWERTMLASAGLTFLSAIGILAETALRKKS